MSDTKEYICNKCKSVCHLSKPSKYCSCGGLLIDKEQANELFDTIFPWRKKK